jgi:putative endopeptidase
VNWQWLLDNPIPASEASWGTFNVLLDITNERLRAICEDARGRADVPRGSNLQLARDFYASGMDMDAREAEGLKPLQPLLDRIQDLESAEDLARRLATLHLGPVSPFFAIEVMEDQKRPGRNALYISQAGLGMPNRDYYLNDDRRAIRERYEAFLTRLFELAGWSESAARDATGAVMRIETALAEASLPEEVVREVEKNYHRYSVARLAAQAPSIDWRAYFKELGIPGIRSVVVRQPAFIRDMSKLVEGASLDDLKHYLTAALLRATASTLGRDFVAEHFDFYRRTLQGMAEPRPLWKDVIMRMQMSDLTEAIGPLYAEKYFSAEDKERIITVVGHVREAFAARVERLTWMSEQTKQLTLQKLANITFKMGYPDTWVDVSAMEIGDSYATNAWQVAEFHARRKLAQLDQPFDRSEWIMPPTIINACADYKREMTFPMAILQPPFYDRSASDAHNYGAIGYVIGHELTHFFDDQGSKFDAEGKLNTWWSKEDERAFRACAEKFVDHFARYSADGVPVNARLTLGENISDVAGMAIALDAFELYRRDGSAAPEVDGLTAQQQMFVAMAQVWAGSTRHEELVMRSLVDPHSPEQVRVNAVVSATPAFYDAFGVREGDAMYTPPEDRPTLW